MKINTLEPIFRPIFNSVKLKLQSPLTADIIGSPLPEIDSSEALEKAREAAELTQELTKKSEDAANLAESYADNAADFSAECVTEAQKAETYISVSEVANHYARENATEANSTLIVDVLATELELFAIEESNCDALVRALSGFLNNTNDSVQAVIEATSYATAQEEANKANFAAGEAENLLPDLIASLANKERMLWDLESKAKDVNTGIRDQITTATSHFYEAQNANQKAAGELSSAESVLADAENKLSLAEEQRALASSAVEEAKTQVIIAQLALEASDNDAAVEIYVQSGKDALENAEKFADEAQTNVANAETEVEVAKQKLESIKDALVNAEKATTEIEGILSAAGLNLNTETERLNNFSSSLPIAIDDMNESKLKMEAAVISARNSANQALLDAAAMAAPTTQDTSSARVINFVSSTSTMPATSGPTEFRVEYTYLLTTVNVTWGPSLTMFDPFAMSLEIWTDAGPSSCPPEGRCLVTTFTANEAGFFIIGGMIPGQG